MYGTAITQKAKKPQQTHKVRTGYLRQIIEAIVCLTLAVILFRNFQIEGYMVTTGSMAPNLLGFHKRVNCPNCGQLFAFGVAFDQSVRSASANISPSLKQDSSKHKNNNISMNDFSFAEESTSPYVSCPNCGQDSIDISKVPRNHGDHLLVHKNAYQFHSPKRWEIIVFRNPQKPTEAYVKRVIGLPEEKIQIYAGDVLIDGKLVRKNLSIQKAVRIPVYDFDHQPRDIDTIPRWITHSENSPWTKTNEGFTLSPQEFSSKETEEHWLTYRHWIRSGGKHRTEILLPEVLKNWGEFKDHQNQLVYNSLKKKLICIGVMSPQNYKKLLIHWPGIKLEAAFSQLYRESHYSPITDFYGYNRLVENKETNLIRDIMLTAKIEHKNNEGQITIELSDGAKQYQCTLDMKEKRATLTSVSDHSILDSVPMDDFTLNGQFQFEYSLFDRQIIIAVNGRELFSPISLPLLEKHNSAPKARPIRISASGSIWKISQLTIHRDVYYTEKGQNQVFQLKKDEFYVLGDNSPISYDSRRWTNGAVHKKYFLGKPFIVHLPSKPARLKIGNKETYIRMPDFKRIRYIR
jgi:signal peptidase I